MYVYHICVLYYLFCFFISLFLKFICCLFSSIYSFIYTYHRITAYVSMYIAYIIFHDNHVAAEYHDPEWAIWKHKE